MLWFKVIRSEEFWSKINGFHIWSRNLEIWKSFRNHLNLNLLTVLKHKMLIYWQLSNSWCSHLKKFQRRNNNSIMHFRRYLLLNHGLDFRNSNNLLLKLTNLHLKPIKRLGLIKLLPKKLEKLSNRIRKRIHHL